MTSVKVKGFDSAFLKSTWDSRQFLLLLIHLTLLGSLGDCWLLSTISSIAHVKSDMIKEIFTPSSYNPMGLYTVRFFVGSLPIFIDIDDFLPYRKNWNTPTLAFAALCENRELWVPLLEKSIAKYMGSYENIIGSNSMLSTTEILPFLTGQFLCICVRARM